MGHVNIEIKAVCENMDYVRNILRAENATFLGIDHQLDTYFKANSGRLKLREGAIENGLIYYDRQNKYGPKQSKVDMIDNPDSSLKNMLTKSLGILAVVDKKREIYWINNVKFHLDDVKDLGRFVEIEAIDYKGDIGQERLHKQCEHYIRLFKINKNDLISKSYSDMLLLKR